ncbi:MAG TPA: efflux RND transporter periplasmic adaptor subunit [Bacteroidota bacterium]|nr:efflux RND transporter periplasmic adaptor subunit [Bacteroidota bacterium]
MKATVKAIAPALLSLLVLAGCGDKHKGMLDASGTLESVDVNVGAKVPGQIVSLRVDEGTRVRAGDTIAVLDQATLRMQWDQAQAGVDLARAQYQMLQNGARSEDISSSEQSLLQMESTLKNATDDYQRMKSLISSHSVTQKQYDDAESRFNVAQAQYNTAKQNLQKMRRFARPEELAAAKARLEQAQAGADLIRKQLTDATITAPVPGIVTHKPVETGELLGAGSTVVTVSRLDTLNLMIYVSDTDLGKVKLGGAADVVVDTYPDRSFPARVVYISPIAEFTPKNIQTREDRTKLVFGVKLEVDNRDGILKAGMPADAYLHP